MVYCTTTIDEFSIMVVWIIVGRERWNGIDYSK